MIAGIKFAAKIDLLFFKDLLKESKLFEGYYGRV